MQQKLHAHQQVNNTSKVQVNVTDDIMERVLSNYDEKVKEEQLKKYSRDAMHELNTDAKDFEKAQKDSLQLQKVQLEFKDSLEDDDFKPFNEVVAH